MKTDFKSILLLQLCFLMQNVRSKHHHHNHRDSDENSQSQDSESELANEVPIVSLESPIPISIAQMNQMSMPLPQLFFPQMSMPAMTMTGGSFATSLLTGQRLAFFRVPSSYLSLLNNYLPGVSTTGSTTTASTTTTSTTTTSTTTTTTTTTTTPKTIINNSTNTNETQTNNTSLENNSPGRTILLTDDEMLHDSKREMQAIKDLRRVSVNESNNDSALESVLHNIMNEFANRIIKTQQDSMDLKERRSMQSRPSTPKRQMRTIPKFRILPIPDEMAKQVLLNLRTVKKNST